MTDNTTREITEEELLKILEQAQALGIKPRIEAEIKSFDSKGELTEHLKINEDGTEEVLFQRGG